MTEVKTSSKKTKVDGYLSKIDSLEDELNVVQIDNIFLRISLKKIASSRTSCLSSNPEECCSWVAYFALSGKTKDGKKLDKLKDL